MEHKAGYTLVALRNGTHGLHSLIYGETMHPGIGPAAEATALYVTQLGLLERLQAHAGEFVVWDVGLGGAANALAILRAARSVPDCNLRLLSFDNTMEPLKFAQEHAEELRYLEGYENALRQLEAQGHVLLQNGSGQIEWEFHLGDFPTLIQEEPCERWPKPHLILFDPFSPAKNPAMWTQPLFARLYGLLDPERPCLMPTYSRSTMLRVALLLAGFFVGTGRPVGSKEETTVATNCRERLKAPLDQRWLAKAFISTNAEPLWEPPYRQAPLSAETAKRLKSHPQF